MEFPFEHETEGKYARLFPLMNENHLLKKEANKLGDDRMVKFGVDKETGERFFHLFEKRVPTNADADAIFGKWATPEARDASAAELKVRKESMEAAKGAVKTRAPKEEIEPSRLFYPHKKMMKEFRELKQQRLEEGSKIDFYYNAKLNVHVNKGEHDPAFAKFQTPEAKAKWDEEGAEISAKQAKIEQETVRRAGVEVEKEALRAAGRHFEAYNFEGFKMPMEPKEGKGDFQVTLRQKQMRALERASPEELAAVHKTTKIKLMALQKEQYRIQINAAIKRGHTAEEFNAMDFNGRAEAAGGANLEKPELSNMFGLMRGRKALEAELNSRGLVLTTEQARSKKEEKQEQKEGGRGPSLDRQPEAGPEAKPEVRSDNARVAANAAALARGLGV